MHPYIERAGQIAYESQIAVVVLLNPDNTDMEFLMLRPQQSTFIGPQECTARQLRILGVVGLCGLTVRVAFKEPLEPPVVEAIAAAFAEYVRVLLRDIAGPSVGDSVAFCERLYALPDTRTN